MPYFLENIAQSLYKEFGNTLNRHCLVFPSRRAGLYFLKYLTERIESPVWVPAIMNVNELFRSYSTLQIAGNEILLFELYKIYRQLKKPAESFDEFYFWGDMLLEDFDDVDKYIVDASLLFKNVLDINKIDNEFGGLTGEQIEIISRFWSNINREKLTVEKTSFLGIWSVLPELYTGFRNSLQEQNLAYEGMIFREIAENLDHYCSGEDRFDMIHFVGFNALNDCEQALMTWYKKAGKARFYWDFDNSYIDEGKLNSAGYFLRSNLLQFGNDMPSDWSFDTMLSKKGPLVRRKVIDASSDVAQVKLVPGLIRDIPGITNENAHHTAVVLADENLLMPVLTSLPETLSDINITMGHPLKQTLVYTLLKHLMDLQHGSVSTDGTLYFDHRHVTAILQHPLLDSLLTAREKEIGGDIIRTNLARVPAELFSKSELLSRIYQKPSTPHELSAYFRDILSTVALHPDNLSGTVANNVRNEFIYRAVLSINKLETIVQGHEVSFTTDTYMRIFDRMLRMQSVPFSGEPLTGIQIMGILETRALDFKNLIILSVNDGILPAVSSGFSFIPFSLREAFRIPSINHQESIYAYHFYRLLQRAENVTFVYNSNSEGLKSGEISRFILQMKYDEILKPDFLDLNFEVRTHLAPADKIERSDEHQKSLTSFFLGDNGRILSPTVINTWLSCRMKFLYRYVYRLKEPETITTDIDPAMLGNILHEIMKNLYQPYCGSVITIDILNTLMRDKQYLTKTVIEVVNSKFKSGRANIERGNELIVRDVLMIYVLRILNADKGFSPVSIIDLERSLRFKYSFQLNGIQSELFAGGQIDRIDMVNGQARIVDYKTGTVAEYINSVADLFADDRKKDADAWLQILLYCEAYLRLNEEKPVRPSVYKIKKLNSGTASDKLKLRIDRKNEVVIDNYLNIRDEFLSGLQEIIGIIFNDREPFIKTCDIRGKCLYCPYRTLCLR